MYLSVFERRNSFDNFGIKQQNRFDEQTNQIQSKKINKQISKSTKYDQNYRMESCVVRASLVRIEYIKCVFLRDESIRNTSKCEYILNVLSRVSTYGTGLCGCGCVCVCVSGNKCC